MSQHDGTYENLPLLSVRFVYALDRSTRYTVRSFRSTAHRRQFKGVTKGGLVENSFQFARRKLIRFHGGSLFRRGFWIRRGLPPIVTGPPRSLSTNIRVKNKIIKFRLRFETRSLARDRRRQSRYLYSVRKYRRDPADVRAFAH